MSFSGDNDIKHGNHDEDQIRMTEERQIPQQPFFLVFSNLYFFFLPLLEIHVYFHWIPVYALAHSPIGPKISILEPRRIRFYD